MERRIKQTSLLLWTLIAGLLSQNLLIPVMSITSVDDEKNYYSPDPNAGSPPTGGGGSHGSPSHGTPPSHGSGGSYGGTPPSHGTPSHGGSHGRTPPSNCGSPPSGGHYDPTPAPPTGGGHYDPTPAPPTSGGGGYYNSPPISGGGTPPTPIIGTPPSIDPTPAPPTTGGGGYYNSPPISGGGTPPTPIIGTPPSTDPTPAPPTTGGGGYYNSPPTTPPIYGGDTPPTPPFTLTPPTIPGISIPSPPFAYDPSSPPFTCNYWRTHPGLIWGVLGWWGTMGGAFGVANLPGFGSNLSLQEALSNARTDGFGALYRQGTASLLNSMVDKSFPFTTQQVRDNFITAVSSNKAAAAQAHLFKLANEGRLKPRA